MPSLVLEGGTFRPIFSCGVMDALLDYNIMFPYIIGVSAGISDAVSYVSMQRRRNFEVTMKYRRDKRYIGRQNFKTCNSIFGLDFVFGEVPQRLVPFDWETYRKYKGKLVVGVTNAKTGQAIYKNGKYMDSNFTMLRATCAIPVYFPEIWIDGKPYFDGGLSDPIPIRKAIADGNKKHLIILTRPKGYQKRLDSSAKMAIRITRKKYPKLEPVMKRRPILYNKSVQFCEELEKKGKAIILRPAYPIKSFEKDRNKLEAAYQMGYEMTEKRIEEIKKLF